MIVHSNAFVYSTCLLVIVFRYGIYQLYFASPPPGGGGFPPRRGGIPRQKKIFFLAGLSKKFSRTFIT